ncbi:hypothetical protein [Alicyclobacillus dauci]|uniref:Uncharacterized protein n=1 Tax=Alicyclobacillus dauci TaxID=1475485 RepID=A0ABY6Z5K6_9BACL|nr:hypothetical protein [Alicyclobacillus dauci]WAH38049.1 hypothetical protein NZD86_06050 [Alicyclobacillus dauci]
MRTTLYLLCGICTIVVLTFVSMALAAPLFVFVVEIGCVIAFDIWLIVVQFRNRD